MKYKRIFRRVVVALGMLFFIFCAVTFIVNYRDVKTEETLETEIRLTEKKMTINNIKNGMTTLKTRKIVTPRNYGKLEEGIKKYYKDYYAEAYAIYYNYDELINTTIESLENIHKDSPEFTTSLEKLAEEKTKLEAEDNAKVEQQYETEKTVVKVWDDNNNARGNRPEKLEAELTSNGETLASVVLSKENKV